MSEIVHIEIFGVEEQLPDDERTVIGFDGWIDQWVEAMFLNGVWIDDEGVDYRPGQITRWFDLPTAKKLIEMEGIQ